MENLKVEVQPSVLFEESMAAFVTELERISLNPSELRPRMKFAKARNLFVSAMRSFSVMNNYKFVASEQNGHVVFFGNYLEIKRTAEGSLLFKSSKELPQKEFIEFKKVSFSNLSRLIAVSLNSYAFNKISEHLFNSSIVENRLSKNEALFKTIGKFKEVFKYDSDSKSSYVPKSIKLLSGLPLSSETKLIAKVLWENEIFEKDILSTAVRMFGPKIDIRDYGWVSQNRQLLTQLSKEQPTACILLKDSLSGSNPDYLEAFEDFWVWSYSDTAIEKGLNSFKELKAYYRGKGLSDTGWRWLVRQKLFFIRHFLTTKQFELINACANERLGVIPQSPIISRISLNYTFKQSLLLNYYVATLKALISKELKCNEHHTVRFVRDYIYSPVFGDDPARVLKKTWTNLRKESERWHRDLIQHQMVHTKPKTLISWEAAYPSTVIKGYKFEQLLSNQELYDEGLKMGHCVGGYTSYCRSQQSLIYRMISGKDTIATIELQKSPTGYRVSQCYGVGNTPRSKKENLIAKELCNEVNRHLKRKSSKSANQSTLALAA